MKATEGARRSWWRILADGVFGPFLVAKLLASIGQWGHNVVSAILAYDLTGSTFVVGLVVAAQFVPQLVLTPISGSLADRFDRRRQVTIGRLISAVGSAMLAVWIMVAGVSGLPGAWPIVLSAGIVGVGFAIAGPALHALLPSMVRRNELDIAVTLNMLPLPIARAGGPIAGVLLATTLGPEYAFGLAAIGSAAFVLVMRRVPVPPRHRGTVSAEHSTAWRFLRSDPRSRVLLIGVAALGVGTDPSITLAPAISTALVGDTTLVGVIATAFGIGAGAGFVLIPIARRLVGLHRYGTWGLALITLSTIGLLFVGSPGAAIVAFTVAGAGLTLGLTGLSATLQMRVPDVLRGRIMALWSVAFLGSRPFAALINGTLTDAFGLQVALATVAVTIGAASVWCLGSDRRHTAAGRGPASRHGQA